VRAAEAAAFALLAVACTHKDEGLDRYKAAYARYESLLLASAPVSDPAFAEISAELRAIPFDSGAHASAVDLADRIDRARGSRVARPITSAAAQECARLAQSGDAGAAAECQRALERKDEAEHGAEKP
jgi:hypothetical protein